MWEQVRAARAFIAKQTETGSSRCGSSAQAVRVALFFSWLGSEHPDGFFSLLFLLVLLSLSCLEMLEEELANVSLLGNYRCREQQRSSHLPFPKPREFAFEQV